MELLTNLVGLILPFVGYVLTYGTLLVLAVGLVIIAEYMWHE